jgi:hypothetical protein
MMAIAIRGKREEEAFGREGFNFVPGAFAMLNNIPRA